MAPERLLGSRDNIKSDIWSLGIIITELVFQGQLYPSLNLAQVPEYRGLIYPIQIT